MTKREELATRGFFFMMFTTPEARAKHTLHNCPEDFECVDVDEVFCTHKFPVYFLGYKRLHHTPVKYTPQTKPWRPYEKSDEQ